MDILSTDMKRDLVKYVQAKKLRQGGCSIRSIARELNISTSTASIWCRDIELSEAQKTRLASKGMQVGLLRSYAQKRHNDKLDKHSKIFSQAVVEINNLSKNEFFLSGLALYWAEGFKNINEGRVGFCNSDPRMIRFIMCWFKEVLKISDQDFTLRAEFNVNHVSRKQEIEKYWSKLTRVPRSQFNAPYLQKTNLKRDYSNRNKYYGLLRIRIRRSSLLLVKLRGWIQGLSGLPIVGLYIDRPENKA